MSYYNRNVRKKMNELNRKIFLRLINGLYGPRCDLKFNIINKKKDYIIIEIPSGSNKNGAYLKLYIGYSIRIAIYANSYHFFSRSKKHPIKENVYYTYYEGAKLPDDEEEYVRITKEFLLELIRYACTMSAYKSDYRNLVPECYSDAECPLQPFPDESEYTYPYILLYPYSYEEKNKTEYFIQLMKSKRFKRDLRKDYKY